VAQRHQQSRGLRGLGQQFAIRGDRRLVHSRYKIEGHDWSDRDWDGSNWGDSGCERRAVIGWKIKNLAAAKAEVSVLNAYTGELFTETLHPQDSFEGEVPLGQFHNWYDLVITVSEDASFKYQLAGHVETGRDSYSDPAMGGLVTLKS
jgi:hypothetical protein